MVAWILGLVAVLCLSSGVWADKCDGGCGGEGNGKTTNNVDVDVVKIVDLTGAGAAASAKLVGAASADAVTSKYGEISGEAFFESVGITTVNMAAGNANIVQANTGLEILAVDGVELEGATATTVNSTFNESGTVRYDEISGNAFAGATGITTVQMSSGNGNVLQSNVNVGVGLGFPK